MSNIYRVNNENIIDELFEKYNGNLICLIFTKNSEIDTEIRKSLKRNISVQYKNIIFLYVNLNDYKITGNVYTKKITNNLLPYVSFYFKKKELGTIIKATTEAISETCNNILQQLKKILIKYNNEEIKNSEKNIEKKENVMNIHKIENIIDNKIENNNVINNIENNDYVNNDINDENDEENDENDDSDDELNVINNNDVDDNENDDDNENNDFELDKNNKEELKKKIEKIEELKKISLLNEIDKCIKNKE